MWDGNEVAYQKKRCVHLGICNLYFALSPFWPIQGLIDNMLSSQMPHLGMKIPQEVWEPF
jgi:hypothetical protein